MTVDPASGRILLVGGRAAVVLSLEDGEELATRRLPAGTGCTANLTPRRFETFDIAVASTAVVGCSGELGVGPHEVLAMVDVASGRLVAREDDDENLCMVMAAAAAPAAADVRTPSPAVLHWCGGPPTLLALDRRSGQVDRAARITAPSGGSDWCEDASCLWDLDATEDLVVATLDWDPTFELVALSREGDVRWRVPLDGAPDDVVLTPSGVVTQDGEAWRLLALDDGRELARQAVVDAERSDDWGRRTVVDDQRIYRVGGGTISVRRLDDLSLLSTVDGTLPGVVASWLDAVSVSSGRVIYLAGDGDQLVAYGDPPTRPPS